MLFLKILLSVLVLLAVLLLVAVIRALLQKPTAAATAVMPKEDQVRAEKYAETLSCLIQKETISSRFDPNRDKFLEFQESLKPLFPHVFARCEEFHPGFGLVLRLKGKHPTAKEPMLFMSHHDVVEAEEEGWKYGPFSGKIDEEGRIWGRGTVDTKGSLFCQLQALEELIEAGWEPETDVYMTSSCTEEWSGDSAPAIVEWLQQQKVHLGLLLDEGGMILKEPLAGVKGRYCMVGVLEKGYGDLKFIARSQGGHASAPGRKTPLVRLAGFIQYIEKKKPFRVTMNRTLKEMFTRMAPNMNFGMKLIFANLWLFGPVVKKVMPYISSAGAAMMQTTCAFTMAKGAEGLNVLPTEAYVTANMRFMPEQPNEESIGIMKKIAEKFGLETQIIYEAQPCSPVEYTSEAFRLLEKTADKIYPGYGVVPYVMTGGTDAKYYAPVCENLFRFAPIEIDTKQQESIHSINENLYIRALVPAVDFYKEILKDYAKGEMINE